MLILPFLCDQVTIDMNRFFGEMRETCLRAVEPLHERPFYR